MDKFPITSKGFERLEEEYKNLKTVERPSIIQQIADARDHGDLKENAEYHSAREKQSFIEGRIAELENYIAKSEVINVATLSGDNVLFGATVTIYDVDLEEEKKYQIVGEYEADLEKGLLSVSSPLAKSIIGKKTDDEVKVKTPSGDKFYEIVTVEFI